MKSALIVAAALALTLPAHAAPVSPEQKADFLKACLKVAPEAVELCTCKAEAAPRLVDSDFMAVVIGAMQGKDVPSNLYDTYNEYIGRSNQICKPSY